MGITGWRNSRYFAALGFCALLLMLVTLSTLCPTKSDAVESSVTSGVQSASGSAEGEVLSTETITADDFFADYLDLLCGLYSADLDSNVDYWDKFNYDVFVKLSERLERDRSKYGHLPEYWEMAAYVKPNPTDIDASTYLPQTYVDRAMLVKALELYEMQVSTDVEDALLGAAEAGVLNALRYSEVDAASNANERVDKDTAKPEDYIDTEAIEIDYYKRMIAAEPNNAFPHFFLANALMSLGEWDAAIDEYNKAGGSEYFSQPTTFPNRYIRQHAWEIERGEGAFAKLSDRDKYTLWLLLGREKLPNFIRVKDAYKNATVGLNIGADPQTTLNALHGAACSMGRNSEVSMIYNLVAVSLINLCARQALIVGHENGDRELESAALSVMNQAAFIQSRLQSIRSALKDIRLDYRSGMPHNNEAIATEADKNSLEGNGETLDDTLILTYERDQLESRIVPMMKELAALDYSHPEVWYEQWFQMKVGGEGDSAQADAEG